MIEQSLTITVTKAVINTLADARELQDWAATQPGVFCTIAALDGGDWFIEVGGRHLDSKRVSFGDEVTWDGQRMTVISPETEEVEPVVEPAPVIPEVNEADIPAPPR